MLKMYMKCYLIILNAVLVMSVILDEISEKQLKNLIIEFEKNPRSPRYLTPFQPAEWEFKHVCQIMLWSPMQQFDLNLLCPKDSMPLCLGDWNSVVSASSNKNPRLAFGFFNNILVIQQRYRCQQGHQYFSSSYEVMSMLPTVVSNAFMFRKYSRSMFTIQLVEYIIEHVTHGMNFQQISESIASLHLKEFQHLILTRHSSDITLENFYDSVLTSYPSRDKVEEVFLDIFNDRKEEFKSAVTEVASAPICLSSDHTFKVGKNVGGHRYEDNKYIKDFMKLFIVLDEEKRVVGWKLTKSTSHAEIENVLKEIQSRSNLANLQYIMVDNCCESRQFYQSIFGDIPVKLDIFHAVQRLTKTLPHKFSAKTRKFTNEIGLVFRSTFDRGQSRSFCTPTSQTLLDNVEYLLAENEIFINELQQEKRTAFLKAVDNLRIHILKSCVSGIAPGHGTESNERLHRLLNYNCMKGVSTISPELIMALLTVLFYGYNKKLKGKKHICNNKIIPIPPVTRASTFRENFSPQNDVVESDSSIVKEVSFPVTDIDKSVLIKLADNITRLYKSLIGLQQLCQKRNFDVNDLLTKAFRREAFQLYESDSDQKLHIERLKRNCAAFGVTIEEIDKDGDCLFRSILRQIRLASHGIDQSWPTVLRDLNLKFDDESKDIITLRSLFVSEVKTNSKYSDFMLPGDSDIESFKQSGIFASNVGDFVVDACSNILQVPIVVLTSHSDMSVEVFFPTNQTHDSPLILAFNCAELHYCCTSSILEEGTLSASKCNCSSNNEKWCCDSENPKSRCPCLKGKRDCNARCRCNMCHNNKQALSKPTTGCRCGVSQSEGSWCCDNPSRKTKCKCFKANVPCGDACKCRNCANSYGNRTHTSKNEGEKGKAASRQHSTSYKKSRTTTYLLQQGSAMSEGPWTKLETATVFCCLHLLETIGSEQCTENIHCLYMLLFENTHVNKLSIRKKTKNQINAKVKYMKQ